MLSISRDSGYADKFRKYKIILDDQVVGKIADGEHKELKIKDGKHTIYCKYGLYKTHSIDFEENGQTLNNFSCSAKCVAAEYI